jgi:hypothetical protein
MPPPPAPPPPTTKTRAVIAPAGTVHSHVPTVEKVKTVSPLTVVDVGLHAAACAGIGNEKKLLNKTKVVMLAILARAAVTFLPTTPKITFTSLLE